MALAFPTCVRAETCNLLDSSALASGADAMDEARELRIAVREEGCARDSRGLCRCLGIDTRDDGASQDGSKADAEAGDAGRLDLENDHALELFEENAVNKLVSDESVFDGWLTVLAGREEELARRLLSAVEEGNVQNAGAVLEEYATDFAARGLAIVNARKVNQRSEFPLAIAASLGDVDMMQLLIDRGCCLRCQTTLNESAIHLAAVAGSLEAVDFLLARGLASFLFVPSSVAGDLLVDQVLEELADCLQCGDAAAAGGLQAVALRILEVEPPCARDTASRLCKSNQNELRAELRDALENVIGGIPLSPSSDGGAFEIGEADRPPGLVASCESSLSVQDLKQDPQSVKPARSTAKRAVSPRKRYNSPHHRLVSPKRDSEEGLRQTEMPKSPSTVLASSSSSSSSSSASAITLPLLSK